MASNTNTAFQRQELLRNSKHSINYLLRAISQKACMEISSKTWKRPTPSFLTNKNRKYELVFYVWCLPCRLSFELVEPERRGNGVLAYAKVMWAKILYIFAIANIGDTMRTFSWIQYFMASFNVVGLIYHVSEYIMFGHKNNAFFFSSYTTFLLRV